MNLENCQIAQDEFLLKPHYCCGGNLDELLKEIKSFISKTNCSKLSLDLTGFNLIYATQLGILVATHHFINYIDGEVIIIVDCEQIKNSIERLNLINAKIFIGSEKLLTCSIA